MFRTLYDRFYVNWKESSQAAFLKKRRFDFMLNAVGVHDPATVLEVGCGSGRDFIPFLPFGTKIWGMDINVVRIQRPNVIFLRGDCEAIPFLDKFFDLTVSLGVLEHIEPIEKLCRVISEIDRVSRAFCHIVPAVNTPLEPHITKPFWQLRNHNRKAEYLRLNYFSDEAWLKFSGFSRAQVKRFWYVPGLISNLCIYKSDLTPDECHVRDYPINAFASGARD